MQAVGAVIRKLLHAIWGMLKYDQNFDGTKFYKLCLKHLTSERVSLQRLVMRDIIEQRKQA